MSEILNKKDKVKDWRQLEFFVPIKESSMVGDEFMIKGVAINETTTRNNIKYIAEELEKAAPSFRNKPILLDHINSVKNIVGRTTENVVFNNTSKAIEFEAKIMDKEIQTMINDGRIQEVSIGAGLDDLTEEEDGSLKAVGLEGMEISLVAVPGDPGAGIAQALAESFELKNKEILMNGEEPTDYLTNEDDFIVSDNESGEEDGEEESDESKSNKEVNMSEEEQKQEAPEEEVKEEEAEAEAPVEAPAEEKLDVKGITEQLASMNKILVKLQEQEDVKEEPEAEVPAEAPVEEPKEEVADETVGEVGEAEEEEEAAEGYLLEKADSGKGVMLSRDWTKESNKSKYNKFVR